MRVHHENFKNPKLVRALRDHVVDRGAALQILTSAFQVDDRIRAAWHWGAFGRGEEDNLSDLDLWLLVRDEWVDRFSDELTFHVGARDIVSFRTNPHNNPPGGGYVGALLARDHGLIHLDIYWQPESMGGVPSSGVILDRTQKRYEKRVDGFLSVGSAEAGNAEIPKRLSFLWLMLSVDAKYLARDPSSDMSLLSYPRPSFYELVDMLGLEDEIGEVDWSTPDAPLDKVELLRTIAAKTAIIETACRAKGVGVSPLANESLRAYFDLVEMVLSESK